MLVGIFGKMGSGKTLIMTILAQWLKQDQKLELWSNYDLANSKKVGSQKELLEIEDGVVALDELWVSMDSRLWKDNVFLTRWINQTRKKNLLVFYTTQAFNQIDVRVRNGTDLLIFCERFLRPAPFFRYSLIDNGSKSILKSFKILETKAKNFYSFYDSFKVILPMISKKSYDFRANQSNH